VIGARESVSAAARKDEPDMRIVVIGLGYVGLPLAVQLARHFDCWGLDINQARIDELKNGKDRTGEVDAKTLKKSKLVLTASPGDCPPADAYIITVPTPIDAINQPDLGPVLSATRMVSKMIDGGRKPVLIYESTVYPGVTEEICGPLVERESGLTHGEHFVLGYSPERINPGDREHTVDRIIKVIAGEDAETTERLAEIYGKVTSAGVYRAASIKAAEAAKVIENAQRDINIAFMNEVTQIFSKLDLSIWDVLDAAGTKWNFLNFQPGLVGGHCIGVDPYYLSYRAQSLGHDPQVILSGRSINDGMGAWIADRVHEKRNSKLSRVLILGLTFKENVPDLRNSKVADVVKRLKWLGHHVSVHDPIADPAEAKHEYGIVLDPTALEREFDVVIGAVPHQQYRDLPSEQIVSMLAAGGLLADLKRMWPEISAIGPALPGRKFYWSL
jgi:UDP-N-acetyl-D-glucosamine/UDP-N-acetyl-D-galactosamine dehydrogenase